MPEHPATPVLRAGSPELWHEALVRELNTGVETWDQDTRDLMMAMAPFHDAAQRLEMDVAAAFRAAAEEGPERHRELVTQFGTRTDINERSFGFSCEETDEGPRYRYIF